MKFIKKIISLILFLMANSICWANNTLPTNFTPAPRGGIDVWQQLTFSFIAPQTGLVKVSLLSVKPKKSENDIAVDDLALVNISQNSSTNMLKNGDFSLGKEGFSTDYKMLDQVNAAGTIAVVTEPPNFGMPNKTGRGSSPYFLLVDTDAEGVKAFWKQDIRVTKGQSYKLTGYFATNDSEGVDIQLAVDGKNIDTKRKAFFIDPNPVYSINNLELKSVVTENSQWKSRVNVWGGNFSGQDIVGNYPSFGSAQRNEKFNFQLMDDGRFYIQSPENPKLCITPNWRNPATKKWGSIWLATDICDLNNPYIYFFLQPSYNNGKEAYVIRSAYDPMLCFHAPWWDVWYDRANLILYNCQHTNVSNGQDRFIIQSADKDERMNTALRNAAAQFTFRDYRKPDSTSAYIKEQSIDLSQLKQTATYPSRIQLKDPITGYLDWEKINGTSISQSYTYAEWKSNTKTLSLSDAFGLKMSVGVDVKTNLIAIETTFKFLAETSYTFQRSISDSTTTQAVITNTINLAPGTKNWLASYKREIEGPIKSTITSDLGDTWSTPQMYIKWGGSSYGGTAWCHSPLPANPIDICKNTEIWIY